MTGPMTKGLFELSQTSGANYSAEPAVNTAAVVTIPAPAVGFRRVIQTVEAWYDTAAGPAAGVITIVSAGVTLKIPIQANVPAMTAIVRNYLMGGYVGQDGASVVVTMPAGAVGSFAHLFLVVSTEPTVA